MHGSRPRLFPTYLAGITRRVTFGLILSAIAASPPALELCAKDKKRSKAAKEQKQQDDANKVPDGDKAAGAAAGTGAAAGAGTTTVAKKVDEKTSSAGSVTASKHPIIPALDQARSSRDAVRKIPGYTCTFSKQEQLTRKGEPLRQTMSLKFRREPFSVYLKYVEPNAGREVIYVEGRNNGKLQVHEASGLASLIGTITLAPTCNDAMKENKYPLTMIGMEKMLERFIGEWEESLQHADTKVQQYPQAKLGDVECMMFEVSHPQQREPLKFHMSRVYFDKKTLLPLRAEQYAFPAKSAAEPQLVEEYNYTDVKTDVLLSETDFDVKNEKYGFK